jgi:hypothetical protein
LECCDLSQLFPGLQNRVPRWYRRAIVFGHPRRNQGDMSAFSVEDSWTNVLMACDVCDKSAGAQQVGECLKIQFAASLRGACFMAPTIVSHKNLALGSTERRAGGL